MAPRANTSRNHHLGFVGVAAKTRRCYEKSVAAYFHYSCALWGRFLRTSVELDEELAEYSIIIFFKKEIMSP